MVATSAWNDWYDRYEAARADWRTQHPEDPQPNFDTGPDAWALVAESPDEPERTTCTDCVGTGTKPADAMTSMSPAPRAALEGDPAAERQGPEPSPAADLESVRDGHNVVADDAQDDRGSIADEPSSAVDRAKHAVHELKGRRALEDQYARDRDSDDQTAQREYMSASEYARCALPAELMVELTAFDD